MQLPQLPHPPQLGMQLPQPQPPQLAQAKQAPQPAVHPRQLVQPAQPGQQPVKHDGPEQQFMLAQHPPPVFGFLIPFLIPFGVLLT